MELRKRAMDLLARREHSREELVHKLTGRGFAPDLVETVIDELAAENLQSDDRFAEAYIAERSARGYGPLYIRQALRNRGIDAHLIDQYLDPDDPEWLRKAAELGRRRFGVIEPGDRRTYAKAVRFLHQRGFSGGQIRRALQDPADWD